MLAMLTYSARLHCAPVPVTEIAASWVDLLGRMLGALVRDRDTIPPQRSIDVRFDEFMADEMVVAKQLYEGAGEELDDDARAAIGDYLLLAGRGDPPLGGMPGRRRCAGKPPRVSQGLTSSRKPSSERHR